ncbi:MAG: hypothetical protein HPY69_05530 [Armatimonadetes bacterium]|nr:hypothetical protein [Armatimonadota bacterium]
MAVRPVLLALLLLTARSLAADDLASNFARPPDSARPWVYWFWLNGNITREGITADLEAMQRVGIGGVLIMEVDQGTPLGPVAFAGPEWRELFRHVVREADRLGLQVNMNDDAGWNGSGGPWITPDKAMQKLTWSEVQVAGPIRFEGVLPQPPTVADHYREVAVLAFPTPGDYRIPDIAGKAAFVRHDVHPPGSYPELPAEQTIPRDRIVDLTVRLGTDGHLVWDVPAGNWTILRLGHTCTGMVNAPAPESGRGLECDKLSPEGAEAAFEGFIARLADDVGPLAGTTFVSTHIDSWENGSQNWTPRFREEFLARRGYDLLPYLPVITGRVVESLEVSERFLYDFRQTVSDLLLDNYAGHMRELAQRRGLRLSIEAYGDTTVDDLAYAGRADEPMGEFWSWPPFSAGGTLTQMASAARVYGKPIIGAEAFTANNDEKWLGHPGSIKAMGDWALCLGINRFVFHRYALQPWADRRPGMSMGPWGLHYERTQTWWEESGAWHQYLARCQYLLRQGLPVVDVLYLAPEGAPRSFNPPPEVERSGYRGDACPAEALMERVSVRGGRLVLPDGMSYRALVLPGAETMTPELLACIGRLARAGATIVGAPPSRAPGLRGYPACDAALQAEAKALWGSGRVIAGKSVAEVLSARGVPPDFSADRVLNFVHRRVGSTDLYFVANTFPHAVNALCSFRATGRRVELWRPETGAMTPVAAYAEERGVTRVPLRLEAAEAVFVVFKPGPRLSDPVLRMTRGTQTVWPRPSEPARITVRKAEWGVTEAQSRVRDVTKAVQRLVDQGTMSFVVADLVGIMGDPAPQVLKTLRVEYRVGDRDLTAEATDPQRLIFEAPRAGEEITIRRAVWGPAGESLEPRRRVKDVTAQVQRLLDRGLTSFQVAELASEGDPAPMVVKTLHVEYESGGQVMTASATDWEPIVFQLPGDAPPPATVECAADGQPRLVAMHPGRYQLHLRSGRILNLSAPAPREQAVAGPWDLHFPPNWGAPEHVALDTLVSWSDHPDPGVRHFSGTGTYRTAFDLPPGLLAPGRRLALDLGRVEVMARVILNGTDLGVLWHAPYRLDVTAAAQPGTNALEVHVTNLWPNRMIGDEQLPEDSERHANGTLQAWPPWLLAGEPSPTGRYTFTTWRLWHADDPLLPSGLLGPVTLRAMPELPFDWSDAEPTGKRK